MRRINRLLLLVSAIAAISIPLDLRATIYLDATAVTNGDEVWYAWMYPTGGTGTWVAGTTVGDMIQFDNDASYQKVNFVRMDPNATTVPSWEAKWNQTADQDLSDRAIYTITGWGDGDMPCTVTEAAEQIPTINNPWASKTYTWSDEDGNTHTSNLTDKATEPNQIMALLNAVYTDPEVPGQNTHNEYLQTGERCDYQLFERNINYNTHSYVAYRFRTGINSYRNTIANNPKEYYTLNGTAVSKFNPANTIGQAPYNVVRRVP